MISARNRMLTKIGWDVFVIADEIHCELVMPGHHYTPFASLSPEFLHNTATCVAPTKAFNIAGLQIANIIVKDSYIRERIDRAINLHEVCDVNPFGVIATEVAYTDEGSEWLRQLNEYIAQNYDYLCQFIAGQLPQLCVVKLEGTYLSWVDCSAQAPSISAGNWSRLTSAPRSPASCWRTAASTALSWLS